MAVIKYSTSFDLFWDQYPKRRGKGAAFKSWLKITKGEDQDSVKEFSKVVGYAISQQKKANFEAAARREFVPNWKDPQVWLNQCCWEDENRVYKEKAEAKADVCSSCKEDIEPRTAIAADKALYCAGCWMNKYQPDFKRKMYNNLKSIGLGAKEGESKKDYCMRMKREALNRGFRA